MADAGPLIALAKTGGLATLFRLYPRVSVPPAGHDEAIRVGRERGAADALHLEEAFRAGHLRLAIPQPVQLVTRMSDRPDIWLHPRLCRQVIEALRGAGS